MILTTHTLGLPTAAPAPVPAGCPGPAKPGSHDPGSTRCRAVDLVAARQLSGAGSVMFAGEVSERGPSGDVVLDPQVGRAASRTTHSRTTHSRTTHSHPTHSHPTHSHPTQGENS